jgi:hypothetical protein
MRVFEPLNLEIEEAEIVFSVGEITSVFRFFEMITGSQNEERAFRAFS